TLKRELGLIHRLDNETSGLVLIARTHEAFQFLREEFRRRRVEKEYLALVMGKISESGKIDLSIAHHPKNKKKMRVVLPSPPTPPSKLPAGRLPKGEGSKRAEGSPAITFFSVEKPFKEFTLLKVRIPTGVRHQIRLHLAHLGHPIVGDILYGGEK